MSDEAPPFGSLAPGPWRERARAIARRLPPGWIGRKTASLLLGPAGGRRARAWDVTVFGDARVRLHPYDNISEKRVYMTPQFWEAEERAALQASIRAGEGAFTFADIGANAGLYTLFARSVARAQGRPFRGVAIEPDAEMRARLLFNLAASGAETDVRILPVAVGPETGRARFLRNLGNRGESRLAETGDVEIEVMRIADALEAARAPAPDALKIDIEGAEYDALAVYFAGVGIRWRPKTIIAELSHERPDRSVDTLIREAGYDVVVRTKRNAVYGKRDQR